MNNKKIKEEAFLNALVKKLKTSNVKTSFGSLNSSQKSVIADFDLKKMPDEKLRYMYSFIPDLLNLSPNFSNLQSFVEVSSFIGEDKLDDIMWMVNMVNPFLPMGYFGVFKRFDILYWKQNNYLDNNNPEENAALVLSQSTFSNEVILDFRDTFLKVIYKQQTPTASLQANKWAHVIFGK